MKQLIPGLLLCWGLYVSCVEELPINTDEGGNTVVVYCILNDGYHQSLRLNYLETNGENIKKAVEGARAWLCGRDTVVSFKQKDSFEWVCDYKPYYGERYELKVLVPGKDTLRSVLMFPESIQIKCNNLRICDPNDSRITLYYYSSYNIFGLDQTHPDASPAGYMICPLKSDCHLWIVPATTTTGDEESDSLKGEYIATDHLGADDLSLYPGKITDFDYFNPDYLKSVGGDLELYNSFIPKFFPGLKLYKRLLHIKHPANYVNGDIKDSLNYPKKYRGSSSFILTTDIAQFGTAVVQLNAYSVTDDYDAYLKKAYEKMINKMNLAQELYDMDAGYSNIFGGQGIFGAYIMVQVPLGTGFLWR